MLKIILAIYLLLCPITAVAKGDTFWIDGDYECNTKFDLCFEKTFYSNDDLNVVVGFLIYLDNFKVLSERYSLDDVRNRVTKLSRENTKDLFVMEAKLYLYGQHVLQDLNRALYIMTSNKFLDEKNPEHAIVLGMIYYKIYNATNKTTQLYARKAKELLLYAQSEDKKYSTYALAVLLMRTNNYKDFQKAGEIMKFLAEQGGKREKQYYQDYLKALAAYPSQ